MRSRAFRILTAIFNSWPSSPVAPTLSSSSSSSSSSNSSSSDAVLAKTSPYLEQVMQKAVANWPQTIEPLSALHEGDPVDEFGQLIVSLIRNNQMLFWKSLFGPTTPTYHSSIRPFHSLQNFPFYLDLDQDLGNGIRPHYFIANMWHCERFVEAGVAVGKPDLNGQSIWTFSDSSEASVDLKQILVTLSVYKKLVVPPNIVAQLAKGWTADAIISLIHAMLCRGSVPYQVTSEDVEAMAKIGSPQQAFAFRFFRPDGPNITEDKIRGKAFEGRFLHYRWRIEFPDSGQIYNLRFSDIQNPEEKLDIQQSWAFYPAAWTTGSSTTFSCVNLFVTSLNIIHIHDFNHFSGGLMRAMTLNSFGAFSDADGRVHLLLVAADPKCVRGSAMFDAYLRIGAVRNSSILLREVDDAEPEAKKAE